MLQEFPRTSVTISAFLDAATVGLIVSNIFMILKMRKKPFNGTQRAGSTEKCITHESEIQVLKSQVGNHAEDIAHIRKRVDSIYNLMLGKKGMPWIED